MSIGAQGWHAENAKRSPFPASSGHPAGSGRKTKETVRESWVEHRGQPIVWEEMSSVHPGEGKQLQEDETAQVRGCRRETEGQENKGGHHSGRCRQRGKETSQALAQAAAEKRGISREFMRCREGSGGPEAEQPGGSSVLTVPQEQSKGKKVCTWWGRREGAEGGTNSLLWPFHARWRRGCQQAPAAAAVCKRQPLGLDAELVGGSAPSQPRRTQGLQCLFVCFSSLHPRGSSEKAASL